MKEWVIRSDNQTGTLLERLLAVRNITEPTEVKEFLSPLTTKLTHPNAFTDMPKAVQRLAKAVDNGENILIYGDFDADGVTSTSLLIKTFAHLGSKVAHFIPNREDEGHGLNMTSLIELIKTNKPKVIVTVDCGISDLKEIAQLKTFGIDTVLTDHHEAPEILPQACAIINPKAQGALDEKLSVKEIRSLTSLAGVGVAFKLAFALLEHYEKTDFVYELVPFVAIGTIADVVPIIGENRYFVAKGLELISSGNHEGITKLLAVAGYNLENGITSENIAFGIAPRINAAGRLETADAAIKVLTSDNKKEVDLAVNTLDQFNLVRQELSHTTFLEAVEMQEEQGDSGDGVILFNPDWHVGIVGIVASKMVEKYYKPSFLMTYYAETDQIRASARSIEEINLYDVISENAELFDGFGGHAMAAGLSFTKSKTSFETVKKALNNTIKEMLGGKKPHPILYIDLEVRPEEVDAAMVDEISRLEPFGAENKAPIFLMRNLTLKQKQLMGQNKEHLKMILQQNDEQFETVWWSHGDIGLVAGDRLDIAFSPYINSYKGELKLQLRLVDVLSDALKEKTEDKKEIKFYDHRKKTDILAQVEDYVKSSKLNIGVFAQNEMLLEELKPYKALYERVCNRQSLKTFDSLFFFDCPCCEEDFQNILEKTKPNAIHFMNFKPEKPDDKEILKKLSGMIKFVCTHKDGKLDLQKASDFLALTMPAVEALLEVFEQAEMIKILSRDENLCVLKFLTNVEVSKVLQCNNYNDFAELLKEIQTYREEFLKKDLT